MEGLQVLTEIRPPKVIESEEMGAAAVRLLELRRRILENQYGCQLQEAHRAKMRAERAGIEQRLEEERDLAEHSRNHLRARILEIEAKLWRSQQLSVQYELELQTFLQLLRA